MTNSQENRLSMFLAARDFLLKNDVVTNSLPNFPKFFDDIKSGIIEIQRWVELQEFDKTGIAIEKNKAKDALIIKTMDIANKLYAYAKFRNDSILMNEIGYKESELRKSSDTLLKEQCQIVHDKGNYNAVDLIQYGITQIMLDEMKGLISDYNAYLPAPRIGIMEKKQATAKLTSLFDLVNSNFDHIDTLAETLKYSDPVFFKGYRGARKIIKSGHSFLSLKGMVVDKNNGLPLQNVRLVLSLAPKSPRDQSTVITKKSAQKGGFNIRNMSSGTWDVAVSREGYSTQNLQVSVVNGETASLVIEL